MFIINFPFYIVKFLLETFAIFLFIFKHSWMIVCNINIEISPMKFIN